MIYLKNIKKEYKNKGSVTYALRGIDLEIAEGDFVAVVGTSGSGKTTLLNILGGMDKASSGSYYYNNNLISAYKSSELQQFRRKYISFVFQNFELLDDYSVFENVEMPLIARRMNKVERKNKVREALNALGLSEIEKKKPNQLSGGQKQRCAIARALVTGTPIILADEPTGALDKKNSEVVMTCFEKLNEMGKTIIIITHDNNIAARCKKIVHIEDGKIVD